MTHSLFLKCIVQFPLWPEPAGGMSHFLLWWGGVRVNMLQKIIYLWVRCVPEKIQSSQFHIRVLVSNYRHHQRITCTRSGVSSKILINHVSYPESEWHASSGSGSGFFCPGNEKSGEGVGEKRAHTAGCVTRGPDSSHHSCSTPTCRHAAGNAKGFSPAALRANFGKLLSHVLLQPERILSLSVNVCRVPQKNII